MTLSELSNIHTIEIQAKTLTRGSAGGMEVTWAAVDGAPTSARISPMSARESIEYQRSGLEVDTKVYFNTDPSMDSNHRIKYDGKYYLFAGEVEWGNLGRGWTVLARYLGSHPDNV